MFDLQKALDAASENYADGHVKKSYEKYQEILKYHPDNITALEWCGELSVQLDEYEQAIIYYEQAKKLNPDFNEYTNLGLCYYETDAPKKAVAALQKAIEIDPDDIVSHSNLGKALYDYYLHIDKKTAKEAALKWHRNFPDNPDAQHMGAAVAGISDAPKIANASFVQDIFNDFSEDFEEKLSDIYYAAPKILCKMLQDNMQIFAKNEGLKILDLGCGTGLLGQELTAHKWYNTNKTAMNIDLFGVDISPNMLKKAKKKKIYNNLQEANILDYLTPAKENFDAIMAADVLCYFGDLHDVFVKIHQSLGGAFIFSLEKYSSDVVDDFYLHPSGRYQHTIPYIERVANDANFRILHHHQDILRYEYGAPVDGLIFVLCKE